MSYKIMEKKYRLNFYISGIDDYIEKDLYDKDIEIKKRGDFLNKRTGKKYIENIAKKTIYTTYEKGFQPAIDELIEFINDNSFIGILIKNARDVSLQICIDLDDEYHVPYIRFTPKQLDFFSKINSDIDFHIS